MACRFSRSLAGVNAFREAVWADVPRDAVPEAFAARRAWLLRPSCRRRHGCSTSAAATARSPPSWSPPAPRSSASTSRTARSRAPASERRARSSAPSRRERRCRSDNGWAQVAWAGEVLEHVVDVQGTLADVRLALAPGGILLATTPAHGPLLTRTSRLDPAGDHLRFFTRRSLAGLLTDVFSTCRSGAARQDASTHARPDRHELRAARPVGHRDLHPGVHRGRCAGWASRSSRRPTNDGRRRRAAGWAASRNLLADRRWAKRSLPQFAADTRQRRSSITRCRRTRASRRARRSSPSTTSRSRRTPSTSTALGRAGRAARTARAAPRRPRSSSASRRRRPTRCRSAGAIAEQRIVVAHHGPGQELPTSQPQAPRHVLYVGDDEPRKNLGLLTRAPTAARCRCCRVPAPAARPSIRRRSAAALRRGAGARPSRACTRASA